MSAARARSALLAATVLVLAVLLGGCGVTIETGGGDDSSSTNPIDDVDGETLAGDERSAVAAIDAFWRETFPEVFGRPYVPPQVKGGYLGEDGPSCSGEPAVAFNAFYCPSQDFIAWDQNLMAAGYEQIGDAWVYLIIAHEWGHAIQARLQRDQVSVAAELQADCLAGATLFGAADRGLLALERGDAEELRQTLAAVADDYPWTKESDHGDVQQRISNFNKGAEGGVEACLPS